MLRFDETVEMISSPTSNNLRRWKSDVQALTDTKAREIGQAVIDNLQNDAQFEEVPYRSFMETLGNKYTSKTTVNAAFNDACSENGLKGPKASIPAALQLHRLVLKNDLTRKMAEEMGWPPEERDVFYNTIVDPTITDEPTRLEFFSRIMIGRRPPVWGGFHQALNGDDPIYGMNVTRSKQIFGLSQDNYPDGEPLVRMKYCPPKDVARRVPTVADAKWRSEWMPTAAGTGYGLTRDLAKKSGKPEPGLGEVVHNNGPLSWLSPPYVPDEVPE